ncbi:MAG: hypothetical protein JW850_17840 [Thermoflexales bacterium]|nr:hypothetical protein [Thermoflexales bacterium]
MTQSQHYLSYLLRLWRSGEGEKAAWRASLESPLTRERLGFASLKALFAFLETQAEAGELGTDVKDKPTTKGGERV